LARFADLQKPHRHCILDDLVRDRSVLPVPTDWLPEPVAWHEGDVHVQQVLKLVLDADAADHAGAWREVDEDVDVAALVVKIARSTNVTRVPTSWRVTPASPPRGSYSIPGKPSHELVPGWQGALIGSTAAKRSSDFNKGGLPGRRVR
jgi:hypothetical protein